jgi:hypothetical protein
MKIDIHNNATFIAIVIVATALACGLIFGLSWVLR